MFNDFVFVAFLSLCPRGIKRYRSYIIIIIITIIIIKRKNIDARLDALKIAKRGVTHSGWDKNYNTLELRGGGGRKHHPQRIRQGQM